ncbi:MAG TPA: 3'(2'),5'-bisphosphate nucleotidase CysQ [Longimicrobiaceae bacterium]|nr:3'(2'),5'-bisphosphate nucleotidase CysQ [Longimicrobiaceae bacterium]
MTAPDPAGLEADLDLALRASRAAGAEVMRFFRGGGEVSYKSPDQPVTEADLAADRLLREVLLRARPGYGWLSEETADSPERLGRARVWVVDPIDGTRSFVNGWAEFAVSVGLVEQGRVVLGVVYNPAAEALYHAAAGGGAFRNGAGIRVAAPVGERLPVALASRSDIRRGEFESLADVWEVRPFGSTTCKMVRVADGTADVFLSRGPKSEWDVCAADLIVREAGGRVTDLAGEPFRYNRPDPAVRGVAVTGSVSHQEVLSRAAALPPR